MATRSFTYDEAAYVYPSTWDVPEFTGNAAVSQKFVSFTNRILKSVSLEPTVATTSSDVVTLLTVSGTTTTTTTIGTIGSGSTALLGPVVVGASNSPPGIAMLPGDQAYLKKGTDATGKYAGEIEYVFAAGAAFSA